MGAYGSNLEMKLRKRGKVINVNKRNLELANVPWFFFNVTFEMWKTFNVFSSFVGNHSWILSLQQSCSVKAFRAQPELRTTRLTVLVRVLRYLAVSFCDAVWFTPFLGFHSGECPWAFRPGVLRVGMLPTYLELHSKGKKWVSREWDWKHSC